MTPALTGKKFLKNHVLADSLAERHKHVFQHSVSEETVLSLQYGSVDLSNLIQKYCPS